MPRLPTRYARCSSGMGRCAWSALFPLPPRAFECRTRVSLPMVRTAVLVSDVRCTVARARGGVVPTLGIAAAKVSRGAPHPGYHRPRRGPGCGYHIDQARGLARGGNTLYPKIPVPEIGYH